MEYKQLGRSGLTVSGFCFGTMIFDEESVRGTFQAECLIDVDGARSTND
jgi:aryl-alcohol dehydrogenase-like predicted oxidoreductase